MNGKSAKWSWADFEALPHETITRDIHCVTKWSKFDTVWNGVSMMFADFVGHVRGLAEDAPERLIGGRYYRLYILWLTFPPMVLLALGQPIGLILAYGVLGSLFMPFLALTLLGLLNGKRIPKRWANRWWTNTALAITALLFIVLGVQQLVTAVSPLFG